MQKLIQQQERNARAKLKNKLRSEIFKLGNFHFFFNLSKIYSAEFFLVFPVSSSACNKKIFVKKYGVTGLVFKIDAINGKKWVKFVAMQQDSATLIYDLNAMKGTVESYLKNNRSAIQNRTIPSLKNHT